MKTKLLLLIVVLVLPDVEPALAGTPIVLTCSDDITVTATSTNGAAVYFTGSAYGGCSAPLTIVSSPPKGSTFPVGTTIVTTTASDTCGDSTNCSFSVTVNKPVYPPIVLTCSQDVTVTATSTNGAAVYFTGSAYGGCSAPLTLASSPPSGSTFPVGTTTVTTTASDTCGDSTNCSFSVTVNKPLIFIGIASGNGEIKLNWLTNLQLALQQNNNLSTTDWTSVTNTPTITNGQNQLILSATNNRSFYRLVNP
jgi:HYR domain